MEDIHGICSMRASLMKWRAKVGLDMKAAWPRHQVTRQLAGSLSLTGDCGHCSCGSRGMTGARASAKPKGSGGEGGRVMGRCTRAASAARHPSVHSRRNRSFQLCHSCLQGQTGNQRRSLRR
jgi:hypothetical protein